MATARYAALPVAALANGTQLNLPLHEIAGSQPGPTVGLCAAIHGDEHTGTEIIYRCVAGFDASQLKGRLLIMPVANPLAYEAITRNTPLDITNLNRVFPGDRNGWLTEQLAWVITEHFLNQCDYLLDFHAGGLLQTVDYVYILNDEEMSRNFGSPLLYRPDPDLQGTVYAGTSSSIVQPRACKAMTIELGGGTVDQGPYVERGVRGIYNVLRTLGVIPGAPAPRPKQTVLREISILRPTQGGLLVPEVTDLHVEVTKGRHSLPDRDSSVGRLPSARQACRLLRSSTLPPPVSRDRWCLRSWPAPSSMTPPRLLWVRERSGSRTSVSAPAGPGAEIPACPSQPQAGAPSLFQSLSVQGMRQLRVKRRAASTWGRKPSVTSVLCS